MEHEQIVNESDRLMQLPAGYEWAHSPAVRAQEIMKLRESVGWQAGIEAVWMGCIDQALSLRGVRLKANGELVGVGFLVGNDRHAILCDLTVHPEHQSKGIGLAILYARMADAERMQIPFLYASIAPKNRLKSVYAQLGFESTGVFRAKNIS